MTGTEQVGITDIIGMSGRYQILLYLICFHSTGFTGTTMIAVELLAPLVNMHWNWDANTTNTTIFPSNKCEWKEIMDYNKTSSYSNSHSKLVYLSPYSRNTLTEKWNLVCEYSWLVSLANVLSLFGAAVGNVLLRVSENYGRKPLFVLVALINVATSLCLSFPQGYIMFAIATFLFNLCTTQCMMLSFIQAVEVTAPSRAPYMSIVMKSALLVCQAIFVFVAWIVEDWFYMQLFQTILTIGFLPSAWYVLESPIWLAVRGKYDEARRVIVVILKRNGRDPVEAAPKINLWLEQMKLRCEVQTTAEKGKVTDLFKNRTITLYTLGLTFTQIATAYVCTALIRNAETFGSGLYVDLTVSNAFSLGSVLLAGIFLKRISLRIMLCICFVLECLACVAFPITYTIPVARSTITVLGRIFISPIAALCMIYVNGVFPTSVRGVGSGFVLLVSYLISTPSPFTKEMSEVTSLYVPFIMYALMSLASAVMYMLLPETKGRPMIHTVNELKKRKDHVTTVSTISTKM